MNDLYMTEILPQMITLTEAYIQIYKRREPVKEDTAEKSTWAAGAVVSIIVDLTQ